MISTEENLPNMPEYRGLFDEAISQRDRVTKRQMENSGEAGRLVRWNLPVI